MNQKRSRWREIYASGILTEIIRKWHSLKLGPEPGTHDLGSETLGHGTLTPGSLEMVPWDPETSNYPPPKTVLTIFIKQILIIKS